MTAIVGGAVQKQKVIGLNESDVCRSAGGCASRGFPVRHRSAIVSNNGSHIALPRISSLSHVHSFPTVLEFIQRFQLRG